MTCTVHYSPSVTVQADCPVCPALAFFCNLQTFRERKGERGEGGGARGAGCRKGGRREEER